MAEEASAKQPFFRHRLFYWRTAKVAYFCAVAQGIVLFAQLYFLALYFESLQKDKAVPAGVAILPILFLFTSTAVATSVVILRTGHYLWAVWAGLALTTLGSGLMTLFDNNTSTAEWAIVLVISGIGHGLVLDALGSTIQACANKADVAHTAAMHTFLRSLGMAIGVTISSTIFQNLLSRALADATEPVAIAQHAFEFIPVLQTLPDAWTSTAAITHAYVHAFKGVFGFLTAVCGIALLLSVIIRPRSLDRKSKTGLELTPKTPVEDKTQEGIIVERSFRNSWLPAPGDVAEQETPRRGSRATKWFVLRRDSDWNRDSTTSKKRQGTVVV